MVLERLQNAQDLKNEIELLSAEDKQVLFQEIKNKQQDLQNNKIQLETQKKSTEDQITELMKQLKDEFGLDSVEEAQSEIVKLQTEINQSIMNFVTEINKFQS